MSSQATTWVYKHGPKDRALRSVLLVIAESANRHGRHSHPGMDAMVEGSLYSRRRVYEILQILEAEGWVSITEDGGGRGKATVYDIIPMAAESEPETVQSSQTVRKRCGNGAETVRDDKDRASYRAPSNVQVQTRGDFDRFWAAYPRKVAKGAARKAWPKAVQVAGDVETVINAAERYANDRTGADLRFTAYPATWLNGERWEDENPPPATNGQGPQVMDGPAALAEWQRRRAVR